MIYVTAATLLLALVPAHGVADPREGHTVTLGDVGLTGEVVPPGMMELFNMDGEQGETGEGQGEGEAQGSGGGGENAGKQFIVKGHSAYSGMFQHQAALIIKIEGVYYQTCGAVIVSKRRAITAAHCTSYFDRNTTFDHFLAVGIHNRSMGLGNPGAQMVAIKRRKNHRKYDRDGAGFPSDISMLYLEDDIEENDYVQYAELAKPSMGDFEHEFCVVSGWGFTEDGRPDILQFGYQYVPTLKDCRLFWAPSSSAKINTKHICGYYYPTSGCFGDSGGPLTCGNVVAGLVSWGLPSCSGCFPVVYTRISSYYHWIVKNM